MPGTTSAKQRRQQYLHWLKHRLPIAWTLALTTTLLVLVLPDTGPEGSPLLVLLVLGMVRVALHVAH